MFPEIMMKKEKEYIKLHRMPGSRPNSIPKDKRDFSMRKGIGPWGNIADFKPICKQIGVDGVALFDSTDSPGEVEYIEF